MMTGKKLGKTITLFLVALLGVGCKSSDERAIELHNKAISASREGRADEAATILAEIVQKYPGTQTAVEANKALAANEALSGMTREIRRETIDMALQLYRLDNGRYPSTEQGIRALIVKPVTGDVPRRWRNEGYIETESILDIVSGYESDGASYSLTIK